MKTIIIAAVAVGGSSFPTSAQAWERETDVGLTQRAVQHSALDAWLRHHGYEAGLHEELGLRHADGTLEPRDAALLGQLVAVDAALGAAPDDGRQPALDWLLAGTALEGVGIERIRNHFLDANQHGLDEHERLDAMRVRFDDVRAGLGTFRGAFTGVNFDGTGLPASRWVDATSNPLSRRAFIAAQLDTLRSATPKLREAALARALVAAGALLDVLQSVGDPANARNDFYTNTIVARSPLEAYAAERYGMLVPPALGKGTPRDKLASFFHSADGTGLADEVGRAYRSPATQATRPTKEQLAITTDALLPHIAAQSAALLDFLFRGTLDFETTTEGPIAVHADIGLGAGTLDLYTDTADGTRVLVTTRKVAAVPETAELARFPGVDSKTLFVFHGVDAAGEPIVIGARRTP
ncbi:MAG: hypothetical protein ABI321_06040 [Polyangia bacterium]